MASFQLEVARLPTPMATAFDAASTPHRLPAVRWHDEPKRPTLLRIRYTSRLVVLRIVCGLSPFQFEFRVAAQHVD